MTKFTSLLLGVAAIGLMASPALAEDRIFSPMGGWEVHSVPGQAGSCTIANRYENGLMINLFGRQSQLHEITFSKEKASYTPGQNYLVSLLIAPSYNQQLSGTAISETEIALDVSGSPELAQALQRGQVAYVTLDNVRQGISLSGISDGMRRLKLCRDAAPVRSAKKVYDFDSFEDESVDTAAESTEETAVAAINPFPLQAPAPAAVTASEPASVNEAPAAPEPEVVAESAPLESAPVPVVETREAMAPVSMKDMVVPAPAAVAAPAPVFEPAAEPDAAPAPAESTVHAASRGAFEEAVAAAAVRESVKEAVREAVRDAVKEAVQEAAIASAPPVVAAPAPVALAAVPGAAPTPASVVPFTETAAPEPAPTPVDVASTVVETPVAEAVAAPVDLTQRSARAEAIDILAPPVAAPTEESFSDSPEAATLDVPAVAALDVKAESEAEANDIPPMFGEADAASDSLDGTPADAKRKSGVTVETQVTEAGNANAVVDLVSQENPQAVIEPIKSVTRVHTPKVMLQPEEEEIIEVPVTTEGVLAAGGYEDQFTPEALSEPEEAPATTLAEMVPPVVESAPVVAPVEPSSVEMDKADAQPQEAAPAPAALRPEERSVLLADRYLASVMGDSGRDTASVQEEKIVADVPATTPDAAPEISADSLTPPASVAAENSSSAQPSPETEKRLERILAADMERAEKENNLAKPPVFEPPALDAGLRQNDVVDGVAFTQASAPEEVVEESVDVVDTGVDETLDATEAMAGKIAAGKVLSSEEGVTRLARKNDHEEEVLWNENAVPSTASEPYKPLLAQSAAQANSEPVIIPKIPGTDLPSRIDLMNQDGAAEGEQTLHEVRHVSNAELEQEMKGVDVVDTQTEMAAVTPSYNEAPQIVAEPVSETQAPMAVKWVASAGSNLREIIAGWSLNEGVELIWDSGEQYSVLSPFAMNDSYEKAVAHLLNQYTGAQNGLSSRPVGQLYVDPDTGAKVLIIQSDRL